MLIIPTNGCCDSFVDFVFHPSSFRSFRRDESLGTTSTVAAAVRNTNEFEFPNAACSIARRSRFGSGNGAGKFQSHLFQPSSIVSKLITGPQKVAATDLSKLSDLVSLLSADGTVRDIKPGKGPTTIVYIQMSRTTRSAEKYRFR